MSIFTPLATSNLFFPGNVDTRRGGKGYSVERGSLARQRRLEGGMICPSYVSLQISPGISSRGNGATGENINPLKYREISVRTRRPIARPRLRPKADPAPTFLFPAGARFVLLPFSRVAVAELASNRIVEQLEKQRSRETGRGGTVVAIFSRNNNLSLSNNGSAEAARSGRLCECDNKCWRNKILLPNNIPAREFVAIEFHGRFATVLVNYSLPEIRWCSRGFVSPPRNPSLTGFIELRFLLILHDRVSSLSRILA